MKTLKFFFFHVLSEQTKRIKEKGANYLVFWRELIIESNLIGKFKFILEVLFTENWYVKGFDLGDKASDIPNLRW